MEVGGMAQRSKHEYLLVMWERYQRAGRGQRSALLDEVMRVCGYHRKYAIGLLGWTVPPRPAIRQVAQRRPTYSEDMIRLLAQVSKVAGYLCAQRRTAALPTWLPWLLRHARFTPTLKPSWWQIFPRQNTLAVFERLLVTRLQPTRPCWDSRRS